MAPDSIALARVVARFDARLRAVRSPVRTAILAITVAAIVAQSLPWVPCDVVDFARLPLLHRIHQQTMFGSDTVADSYEARVVLNDLRDMYTKRETEQTALESYYWSRAASASSSGVSPRSRRRARIVRPIVRSSGSMERAMRLMIDAQTPWP